MHQFTRISHRGLVSWGHGCDVFGPQRQLKVLVSDLSGDAAAEDVKKVMDVCAKGTKCVEKLGCKWPLFYGDSSSKFFEANRASLASVTVRGMKYEANKELDELLDSLLKLSALEEVYLDCTMPVDARKTLQKYGVHWVPKPQWCDVPPQILRKREALCLHYLGRAYYRNEFFSKYT